MEATVKWVEGLQFVGQSGSKHAVVMDTDPQYGGFDAGVRPTELLLLGLGGCSGMDVISILQKKRQQVTDFSISVKAEKSDTHPKRFTAFEVVFTVTGKEVSEEAVRKAVEASMQKYCSVKATLEGSAQITYSYKIVEA